MKRAPIVVLGTVKAVSMVKSGSAKGPMEPVLDFVKVEVAVETAVRGRVGGSVQYGVWCYSPRNRSNWRSGAYWPEVGQRKLFFLEESDGGLRAIGDFLEFAVPVHTGRHEAGYCQGKEDGVCMADLLLRMQEGGALGRYLYDLVDVTVYPAGELSSPRYAMQVLEELTGDSRGEVAARARDALEMAHGWWPDGGRSPGAGR